MSQRCALCRKLIGNAVWKLSEHAEASYCQTCIHIELQRLKLKGVEPWKKD